MTSAPPAREAVSVDWAAVYRATYRELVRYLHRKVWDLDRAEELAQEAFVRALDRSPENPRAWLFHVAGNLARDEARTVIRRKKHLTLLRTEQEHAAEAAEPASTMLERTQREEGVRRALEALAERDREVLLLWDSGLSYREIAGATGLAVGAVGTTLARARQRLVQAYEELEGENAARG